MQLTIIALTQSFAVSQNSTPYIGVGGRGWGETWGIFNLCFKTCVPLVKRCPVVGPTQKTAFIIIKISSYNCKELCMNATSFSCIPPYCKISKIVVSIEFSSMSRRVQNWDAIPRRKII